MKLDLFQPGMVDSWVVFQPPAYMMKAMLKNNSIDRPELNGGVGFVYIDHEAGISLRLHWTVAIQKQSFELLDLVMKEQGSMLLFRYGLFNEMGFYPLNSEELKKLDLPDYPESQINYLPNTAVQWMRQDSRFDTYRASGFPDDLRFTIFQGGLKPEDVWGRFEGLSSDGFYVVRLMNRPHQNFGVNFGKLLKIKLANIGEEEPILLWMPDFGTLEVLEDITLQLSNRDPDARGIRTWKLENKNKKELVSYIHTLESGQAFKVTGKERLEIENIPNGD